LVFGEAATKIVIGNNILTLSFSSLIKVLSVGIELLSLRKCGGFS